MIKIKDQEPNLIYHNRLIKKNLEKKMKIFMLKK
jgi:hypothetical protein